MSYDIYLNDADGETLNLPSRHVLKGGTYALGGTSQAWLNITYNYAPFFLQADRRGEGNPRDLRKNRARVYSHSRIRHQGTRHGTRYRVLESDAGECRCGTSRSANACSRFT